MANELHLQAMFPYMAWIGAYEWVVAFLKHPLISPFVEPKASDRLGMGYLYHVCVFHPHPASHPNPTSASKTPSTRRNAIPTPPTPASPMT